MKTPYVTVVTHMAAFGVVALPVPPILRVALLVTMRHWLAPFIVYFTQRMPGIPRIESLAADDPLVPQSHRDQIDILLAALGELGFVECGRLRNSDRQNPNRITAVLLQHPATSDVAHVLVGGSAAKGKIASTSLWFSRGRRDGSRIRTGCSTLPSIAPPVQRDSVISLRGSPRPPELWRLHQGRVAVDPQATRIPPITDVLAFQTEIETKGVERHLASGYWQYDRSQLTLRPTVVGALRMPLRMLFPWKQLSGLRARAAVRRLALQAT